MNQIEQGKIVTISGRSGVGKDTVINHLVEISDYTKFAAYTTRPMRPNEQYDIDYRFIEEREFNRLISEKEFLDHILVNGFQYGTPLSDFEEVIISGEKKVLHLALNSAFLLKSKINNVSTVFILSPSEEEQINRLRKRGMTEKQILSRLAEDPSAHGEYSQCDFIIVNETDKQNQTAEAIHRFITS